MRNDALDELDDIPSLTAGRDEREPLAAVTAEAQPRTVQVTPRAASQGPLWALLGAMGIALGGLAWWSMQQQSLLAQQLVATQESFARISEEAAGRIQDISGQVVATESSVLSDSEALKLRVKQLEEGLAALQAEQRKAQAERQQQASRQAALDKRVEQLLAEQQRQLEALDGRLAKLGELPGRQAEQDKRLAAVQEAQQGLRKQQDKLAAELAGLAKRSDPSAALGRVEQELLVLRSQLDNQAPSSTAEFDAFRAQVTRNINALQAQMQTLQQQLNAR